MTSPQAGSLFSQSPRFGARRPERTLIAVDLPIPFGPRIPTTLSWLGVGRRNKRKPLRENRCIMSVSSSEGRLMMITASSGHNLARTTQGGQANSDIFTVFPSTIMHSLSHIWDHFWRYRYALLLGLQRSCTTTATLMVFPLAFRCPFRKTAEQGK